jgi:hypothetical protein
MIYISSWTTKGRFDSDYRFFNLASKEHPIQELRELFQVVYPTKLVLLSFYEVGDDFCEGYYKRCIDENGGEMLNERKLENE